MINLVESPAGQNANEFGEVMARSQFPDGSTMLAALHAQGRLIKVSTDQIDMIPNATVSVQLSELNQIIADQMGTTVDALSIKNGMTEPKVETKPAQPATVAETAPVTNAVVAINELLSPGIGVGAVGPPINAGLSIFAFNAKPFVKLIDVLVAKVVILEL